MATSGVWTDEELVRQFRAAAYVDGSPLTARVRAWVAVKAVLVADVWPRWARAYLADKGPVTDAWSDAAADAYHAACSSCYYAVHRSRHYGAASSAHTDAAAALAAAEAVRPLRLDEATLASYIREANAHHQVDEGVSSWGAG